MRLERGGHAGAAPPSGGGAWGQPGSGSGAWSSPPPALAPTEPLAIWALVCAIVTVVVPILPAVVAFVLAAQAARRIRDSRGALAGMGLVTGARWAAVGGLVLNVAYVALLVWLGIAAFQQGQAREASGPAQQATGTTVPGGAPVSPPPADAEADPAAEGTGVTTDVLELQVGDCYLEDVDTSAPVGTVELVDCAAPHRGEVAANIQLADGSFPGDEAVTLTAEQECDRAFEEYVGVAYDVSGFGMVWLRPTEETWASGDRTITCTITALTETSPPLVGSVQNTFR